MRVFVVDGAVATACACDRNLLATQSAPNAARRLRTYPGPGRLMRFYDQYVFWWRGALVLHYGMDTFILSSQT